MRLAPFPVAAVLLLAPLGAAAQTTPVVLELFTSQGCSSCPPADALLTELAGRDGVIALALHVDYWDYLGWKDEFARAGNTARQRAYAKAARSRTIFTPEMIVQGDERLKGHDATRILQGDRAPPAAAGAGRGEPGARGRRAGDPPRAAPAPSRSGRPTSIWCASSPSAEVAIEGGENAGRTSPIPTSSPTGRRSGIGTAPRRSTCATRRPATARSR